MKKLILLAFLLAAGATFGKHPEFSHDITGTVKPWTNENFPDLSEKDGEFSFAVIPDRTGRPRKGGFKNGPETANILPDGIVPDDVVTQDKCKVPVRRELDIK